MVAASEPATKISLPSDREIVLTRVVNAPRAVVFEAWTKPEHVKRWWGLRHQQLSVCEIDLRPGGSWRYVLRDPNGQDFRFHGVYREVVPPSRLVYTEYFDEPSIGSPEWLTTLKFEEKDGSTTLTSTVLHKSKEARDGHLQSGMEKGSAESLDRLAEHLRTMA